ncbi:MAG TPA: hypothetical protein VFY23_11035 [Candidatus Limnocylindrales bacterium]|nr:hypothetical protein [Candidatus Limnocylindrales bacterium]
MDARTSVRLHRIRRTLAAVLIGTAVLSAGSVPVAQAAKPDRSPAVDEPIEFATGEVCAHAIRFENTVLRSSDTLFGPAPDGSQRLLGTGMAVSEVVDLVTLATYRMRGGFQFTYMFEPDGSIRVDGQGTGIIAWYYPGDNSELGPGLWDVDGRVTEWYAPDGTFIRASMSGGATDICGALAG